MTIAEFIKARIDEDEEAARSATTGPWTEEYSGETGNVVVPADAESAREFVAKTQLYAAVFDARHIARHDPARVLAEVAAKRLMVAHIVIVTRSPWPIQVATAYQADLERLLRIMARPYADHPDFDPAWGAGLYPTVGEP